MNPRSLAEEMERRATLPTGAGERFVGYGVMGLPFASGQVLAFRRMTASSLGPAYTTVWHRDEYGRWTFFTNVNPNRSCPRFFGGALEEVIVEEIELSWEGPFDLSLRIPVARFQWGVRLSSDLRTQGMSAVGRVVPGVLWRSERILSMVGSVGGRLLGLGNLALTGSSPNRQRYRAAPRLLWRVEATAAILDGQDLGEMASLPAQARLGDFWIPNAGIFVVGEARFEDFDPEVHSSAITRPRNPVSLPMDREAESKYQ
jgi:hypothetical protein